MTNLDLDKLIEAADQTGPLELRLAHDARSHELGTPSRTIATIPHTGYSHPFRGEEQTRDAQFIVLACNNAKRLAEIAKAAKVLAGKLDGIGPKWFAAPELSTLRALLEEPQ